MDYMSDVFLKEEKEPKPSRRKRGRQESSSVQPLGKKQILEIMDLHREKGLEKKLDSSNKGFKLLQKMGYTEGTGLGKNESGQEEPLSVSVREKSNRSGIGIAAETKRITDRCREKLEKYRIEDLEMGFQASQRRKMQCRQLSSDVRIAETAIMELDERNEVDRHNLWPEEKKENLLTNDDDDSHYNRSSDRKEEVTSTASVAIDDVVVDEYIASLKRLENCIMYLRSTYVYCMFCGCSYEDIDELCESCPGPLREDHDDY